MEKKEVKVEITGFNSAEKGKVTTESKGYYYDKDSSEYVAFEEKDEEGNVVNSLIKISGNTLEITRKGNVTTKMFFKTGEKHAVDYLTPYGTFKMVIHTNSVSFYRGKEKIEVNVAYRMSVCEGPFEKYDVKICIYFLVTAD